MKKITFLMLTLLYCSGVVYAQALPMPRNIHNAIKKGTRTVNGVPGASYWQNGGDYFIEATVDAAQKLVAGKEKIVYYNRSPDSLKTIVIRFVNNIHKAQAPRVFQVNNNFLTTGLRIKSFVVNGEAYDVNSENWGTVGDVRLRTPLLPKTSAEIEIEWDYPLSRQSGREGQIDPNTFFCAYFYPRISVYDDYNGWDRLPHTGGGEFYNNFNNYTVSVKVPTNYVVWATGTLENAKDVLQPAAFKRFRESLTSNRVINVATARDMEQGAVTNYNEWNEWKFTAANVPDFTFATSNHFVWDAGSVVVANSEGVRRVSVQAAYKDTAADFRNAVTWSKSAISWFSNNIPGVAYPYPAMTAVQGFADMEYPMMVNDATVTDHDFARLVMNHEIAHTYFPFYMGINETRYAYMDEGWATTFEYLIGVAQNGKSNADEAFKNFRVRNWINNPATESDQPIISMSSQLSGAGYGYNAYVKSSLAYLALRDLLGEATFKKALISYISAWAGKHPTPWDFFYSFNAALKKDLNWFWSNWFYTNNYIDLKIANVEVTTNNTSVTLDNVGGFAIPFDVVIKSERGTKRHHFTPEIWQKDQKTATFTVPSLGKTEQIMIEGGIFMDATPEDNVKNL